jgi:hypothetical protein
MMVGGWVGTACARLRAIRRDGGGWGYRPDTAPCAEATALAGLALRSTDADRPPGPDDADSAADWLASIQRPDGSLGASEGASAPGWPTPYAILLWAGVGGHATPRRLAVAWLLGRGGNAAATPNDGVIGHDGTLVGWPWVADTHSWLEPTALAVLALRREGLGGHARTVEGLRLIRDRAVADGGWNYGNSRVFGRTLRAQPGPTGLALLALAGTDGSSAVAARAIDYLLATLPSTRSAASLGWGLMGLKAWGRSPPDAEAWLEDVAQRTLHGEATAPRLAYLLLSEGARWTAFRASDAG